MPKRVDANQPEIVWDNCACIICGIGFHRKQSGVERHGDNYCSIGCMADDYKTRMLGKNNPNYKGAGWRICIECDKAYKSYNKRRKYCSRECYNGSTAQKENAKRANDKTRKPNIPCKICGKLIYQARTYCDKCNPYKEVRVGSCRNCKTLVASKYDIDFCKACRSKGLHKKEIFSICSKCGEKVPGKPNRKYCDACWKSQVRLHRGHPRRKDANQPEIVDGLEKVGASVIDASAIGGGFPDLVVGYKKRTFLLEVKNPKAKGKLNELQEIFFATWRGQVAVVNNLEEALAVIGAI